MDQEGFKQLLIGKTIIDAKVGWYLHWVVLDEITLDNGTIVELGGNADVAYPAWIKLPDGTAVVPKPEKN